MTISDTTGSIKAWSFSRLEDWTKCCFRALLKHGLKVSVPEDRQIKSTIAKDRGIDHHTALQEYVTGIRPEETLPDELRKHIDKFDWREVRERYAAAPESFIIEEEWACDEHWQPCDWFADEAWGRAKVDRGEWLDIDHTALTVTDYKTGKKFGNEVKHALQMQSYAAFSFARFSSLQAIEVQIQYTDEGKVTKRRYTREQAVLFTTLLDTRARSMTSASKHPPKPSNINCAWCEYGPNNGGSGVCEYGVETKK